ncbi:MAG: hypothetical protein HRU41_01980 [Saprospiraceae bacterium]|nr:hypothetical protein [Saprospiraceae bacterium]
MKITLRILKWISLSLLGLVLLLILLLLLDRGAVERPAPPPPSEIKAPPVYSADVESNLYNLLLEEFGQHKSLAKGYELQCLLALSHYPELKEVPIDFVIQETFIPLASRPAPITVLLPWLKRKYLVVISSKSAAFFEGILMHNLPINEQVGVLGHELAHTLFYLDKNSFQLARIAYQYEKNGDFHDRFEQDTDKRAVAHGLGYQLYDYAFFVRKSFGNTQEEIANEEGGTYLSPKELAAEMEKYPFYRDTLRSPDSYFTH